ncbi:MAG TPA: hypothetical protein VFT86_04610 [Gaiellaceae bacterium]|nr:hypothetical protein [Gaiellaceae bacterium]
MHVYTTMKASCGTALVCVIAILAGSADAARPTSATFTVTIQATVTKDWNTAVESTEGGCTVVRRSIGHRTVTLRSLRPTTVVVRVRSGKASFSPSAVRFVTAKVTQSGENRARKVQPCGSGTDRERCRPSTRRVSLGPLRFVRSRRNELTFRPTTLPRAGTACPRESAPVRAIRPGLRDAAGQIAEVELAGGAAQTAFASADATTDLEGAETGRVVERVRWSMTFARP